MMVKVDCFPLGQDLQMLGAVRLQSAVAAGGVHPDLPLHGSLLVEESRQAILV